MSDRKRQHDHGDNGDHQSMRDIPMESWKHNENLKFRMLELVTQNFQQKEILCFIQDEFPIFSWSLRTLQRRLQFFEISHNDKTVDPSELFQAVKEELSGAGKLLGYRALHKKIRTDHGLRVKRDDVYLTMGVICPEKLEERRLVGNRKKFHKREFTSKGSNWLWSMDGHDKLMGRYKAQFPLGIHGCIDSFSRKIIWLKIWPSNSIPELPGKLFWDAILEHGYVPNMMRSDQGGENGIVATMMNFLHNSCDGYRRHIYGSSTTNQVIEQWWRGYRERNGEYFKELVLKLAKECYYDEKNETCRVSMAFVFLGLIQKSLNSFKDNWNTHRIWKQDIYRPCGVPNFMYQFPEQCGGEQCGLTPDPKALFFLKEEVCKLEKLEFIDEYVAHQFQGILQRNGINEIKCENAIKAYDLLYSNFKHEQLHFEYQ